MRFAPPAPQATEALPEALPLDVRYEDPHLLVVDKAAGMAVHPAPGTPGGTVVNAVLHHCRLPAMRFLSGSSPPADGGCPTASSCACVSPSRRTVAPAPLSRRVPSTYVP